ncbi:MAG: FHA domain-containing protein [Neisseria sp.]|nr:FHA domain-containing protein [Neisseria sp.]
MNLVKRILSGLLALCLLAASAYAADNPVIHAGQSVYRLWIGIPLPDEVAARIANPQILSNINDKGYVLVVGEDNSRMVLFKQKGRLFLMLGHGSGYLVSKDGHIISNHHVLGGEMDDPQLAKLGKPEMFVVRAIAPKLDLLAIDVLTSDKEKDLAIGRVDGLEGEPLPLGDSEYFQPTMPVFSLGFPGASDDVTSGLGFGDPEGFIKPVVAEGTLKREFKSQTGSTVWEHHAPISGGNSGGPLVNQCGQVVGTNYAGHVQQQNTVLAVSNSELIPMLKKQDVPFKQESGRCLSAAEADAARQTRWIYLLLLLVAGLGCAGAVYLNRLRAQVRAGANPPINSQLLRRMAGLQADNAAATRVYGGSDGLTLTSLNGGRDIVLPPGRDMVLGRGRGADIVLNHPQVSGRHIRLKFDGGSLEAEDLGSTNGSFVNDQPIGRAVLQAGDILQLTRDQSVARFRVQTPPAARPSPAARSARLEPLSDGLPAISLSAGQVLGIGRTAGNDIVIARPAVSGRHCRIGLDADGSLWVEDLNSTNGTFVDNPANRVGRAVLADGQTVYLAGQDTAYRVVMG